ncbi:serine/threonine protein kinase [Verrucomicrobium sp. GAS474]|uniref:serine/threonine protein kinase n=1 Tax=Verrucomicrobium sp. GAS474 TaxID=1882831 RepID=UPI0012FFCD62|nr:serine/threonine protein kinase [Verrucomicrobium sp. GAS474]
MPKAAPAKPKAKSGAKAKGAPVAVTEHAASAWGDRETEFFYDLTPDRILAAAELTGVRCTGRMMQMNSMENRVWEVEIEVADEAALKSRSEKSRILKFYRPGRWSQVQIEEEHRFLLDLQEAEVPVVAPLPFAGKGRGGATGTLASVPGAENLFFTVFPKVGGRHPDEMSEEQLVRVGRQLGRMHNVGASGPDAAAPHRLRLTPEVYGYMNLDYLLETEAIPERLEEPYVLAAEEICGRAEELFADAALQRIHGDCHLGNLLWADSPPHDGPFWVDFDDMVVGPPVQDIWLIVPGRDDDAVERREHLLRGYGEMRDFDRATLRLIEPLRALRYIHFSAWIAKRWIDPAFPRRFEHFGTESYWTEQVADLREQVDLMRAAA